MGSGERLDRERLRGGYQDWMERVTAMHHDFRRVENDPVAWSLPRAPLELSRVALVTTAGVQPAVDAPFDELSELGDPSYRVIPSATPGGELVVRHNHYDHRDADRDINCVFPIDRLRELAAAGRCRLATSHFGFMGFNPDPEPLLASAAEVARRLAAEGADLAVLTPG